MANSYLTFSEVVSHLTAEEEQWLHEQLQLVYVFDGVEQTEDQLASDTDLKKATWIGCRAWRDMPDYEEEDRVGFEYAFHDDHGLPIPRGRHLWVYDEEQGDPGRVAHLVRKFLKQFRPGDCWSLTYALTCSKPSAREFGGGGVFVTASEIEWYDGHDLVDQKTRAFAEQQKRRQQAQELLQRVIQSGLPEGILDEAVCDAISSLATDINNANSASQLECLIDRLGFDEVNRILAELIEEHEAASSLRETMVVESQLVPIEHRFTEQLETMKRGEDISPRTRAELETARDTMRPQLLPAVPALEALKLVEGQTMDDHQEPAGVIVEVLQRIADVIEETYGHDEQGNRTDEAGRLSGADVVEALCFHEALIFQALEQARVLQQQTVLPSEKTPESTRETP